MKENFDHKGDNQKSASFDVNEYVFSEDYQQVKHDLEANLSTINFNSESGHLEKEEKQCDSATMCQWAPVIDNENNVSVFVDDNEKIFSVMVRTDDKLSMFSFTDETYDKFIKFMKSSLK